MDTPTKPGMKTGCAFEQKASEKIRLLCDAAYSRSNYRRVRAVTLIAAITGTAAQILTAAPSVGAQIQSPAGKEAVNTTHALGSTKKMSAAYRLCPDDLIQIKVFQEDELDTSVRIAKDGSITFPMIGSVAIGDKTLAEASHVIEGSLRTFCKSPQVVIRIVEYNKRRFTVLGQVNRPGTFEMPDENPLSLLEAIGMAGGYSRIANPSKVTLKRTSSDGSEQIFRLDAKRMARESAVSPFLLKTGDTIVVEETLF